MNLLDLHHRFRRYCSIEEGLRPRTIKSMESNFKTFLKRTEVKNIADMALETLKEFFYVGSEKYLWSYWTYCNHHKYLKKFLDWAVKGGYLKHNPIHEIKKPKKPQKLPRRLSLEEGYRVLYSSLNCTWTYAFEQSRNHAIIATLLYTGLRADELINLSYGDVNLESDHLVVREGKGGKDRYIPIHFKLKSILKRYEADKKRLKKNSPFYFISSRSNKGLNYKDLSRLCKKIVQFSGVHFTPHQLRHTFASISIEQGIGLPQLQQVMGHSSIQSTMIYLSMTPKGLTDSFNKIDLF